MQKKAIKFQLWAQGALQCNLIVPICDDLRLRLISVFLCQRTPGAHLRDRSFDKKTSVFDSLGMRKGFHLPHRRTPKETGLFISCIPSVWLPFSYFRLFSEELKVKVYLTVSLWLCQPPATHSLLYSVIISLLSQPDTF